MYTLWVGFQPKCEVYTCGIMLSTNMVSQRGMETGKRRGGFLVASLCNAGRRELAV